MESCFYDLHLGKLFTVPAYPGEEPDIRNAVARVPPATGRNCVFLPKDTLTCGQDIHLCVSPIHYSNKTNDPLQVKVLQ